ncbi:hypothetical protein ANCDUO_18607, partial [Ancylostoma duodenale]
GYKPRQALFACLTCAPDPEKNEAGVCYGCSVHCHDGHNIVELFTKRRFRRASFLFLFLVSKFLFLASECDSIWTDEPGEDHC